MRKSDGVEVGTLFVLMVFDTSRVGDAMVWNGVGSVRPQAEPELAHILDFSSSSFNTPERFVNRLFQTNDFLYGSLFL